MNRRLISGYLLICNTIIFFSSFEVVSRTISGVYSSIQINFFRFLIGGLVLLFSLFLSHTKRLSIQDVMKCALLGFLNIGISMNLLQLSLSIDGASAALSAVLFSTNPIFVILFASIITEEKLSFRNFYPIAPCLLGIGIIFLERINIASITLLPALLALLSSLTFGLYTVLGRNVTKKIGSRKMNAYSFLFGCLFIGIPMLVIKPDLFTLDHSGILPLAYLGLIVSGLAYLTYFKGLSIVGAGKGSIIFFLKPVIASLLAFVFLQESISITFITGTCCIMVGVFLNFKQQQRGN